MADQRPPSPVLAARRLLAGSIATALVAVGCSRGGHVAQPPRSPSPSAPAVTALVLAFTTASYRLDAPVQREVAVSDGHRIYLAGGLDAGDRSAAGVFSLDPATGRLTILGSVPSAFHDAAGAFVGGRLLVFGGGSSSGTDLVQAFDPATGRGTVIGHLPTTLSDLSAATVGRTVYLVGGFDGHVPRREIYATGDGTSFRVVGRLPVGLRYPAVAAVGSTIVIAGGQSAHGPVDTVSVFDTADGSVSRIGTLPSPLAHAAAFAIGGRVSWSAAATRPIGRSAP